ncbi:DUF6216 family protein [Polaromonas aquatica]|uniref:DUF6216 family protein n=1 Tax=Polaromonas aquatica TaxID=332657 RepID=UPI003D65C90C
MDLTALSTISGVLGTLAPGGFVLLFLWVIWRTESRHTLIHRLWQLVHGNQEIVDPDIKAFVNEQNSLMSFRFIAGVPVSTLEQARQLIQWTKLRNVEMLTLRMAGKYFDPDQRQVRTQELPSKFMQWIKLISLALCFPVMFLGTSVAFMDSAVVKVNLTNRRLLLSESEARPIWPWTTAPIHKATCSGTTGIEIARSKFSEEEVRVLCEVLKDDKTPKYIQDALETQKRSSIFLVLVTLLTAWISLAGLASSYAAKGLARRALNPGLDDNSALQLSRAATLEHQPYSAQLSDHSAIEEEGP